jgi:hypothetical protein
MTIDISLFRDILEEIYLASIPTPEKKREAFMDRVREKVNYYQPRIEKKCGVSLGKVKVKDNKELLSDFVCNNAHINALRLAWKNGRVPTELDYTRGFIKAKMIASSLTLMDALFIAYFKHYNNTIYVPFNYMNRLMDIDFEERAKGIDYGVVHELSHTLWNKLDGRGLFGKEINSRKEFKEGRRWMEGFATYCCEDYFADLYTEETKIGSPLPRLYKEGKEKIKGAVAKHGEEILLKIPKVWRELAKEN